jgi:hypothetical protein
MLREFLDDLGLACRLQLQARQSLSDFRFPVRHIRQISVRGFPRLRRSMCGSGYAISESYWILRGLRPSRLTT